MKKISIICFVVCFLLTGCHINHKGEMVLKYEHPERYRAGAPEEPISGVSEIDVTWLSGGIDIVYADIPGVRISEEATYALDDTSRLHYYVDDEGCLNIQFCQNGKKYNPQKMENLEGLDKNLTIEVPRGTVLDEIDMDLVSTHVRIDSVACRELNVDGVIADILTDGQAAMPNEINVDGVCCSLTIMAPPTVGMTIEMTGVKKYLNSQFPTRKESGKTIIGDGACKVDIEGVNCTLKINK